MTRTEELMNMTGANLIELADKYGVKVYTNKERKQLKEKKTLVVERILKHEQELAKVAQAEKKESKKEREKKKDTPNIFICDFYIFRTKNDFLT